MDQNLFFVGNWSNQQLAEMGLEKISDHFNPAFRLQNKFADQSLHDKLSDEQTNMFGVQCIYYVSSLDTNRDKIYHEDPTQTVERSFHISVNGEESVPADKVKFGKFFMEGLDEFPVYIHRTSFYKRNYISLKQEGIEPELDPRNHDPIYYARNDKDFNYMGYSAGQMFPKASDLIKTEWSGKLYEITDVAQEISDQSFLERHYFFKITLRQYRGDHRDVSNDVIDSGFNTDGFIFNKFDRFTDADVSETTSTSNSEQGLQNGGALDKLIQDGDSVREDAENPANNFWKNPNNKEEVLFTRTKDDVLYRPDSVPKEQKGVSDHKRYRPNIYGNA